MDADKAYREKTRQELYKNITSYTEQILEVTKQQLHGHLPPISKAIQIRQIRHVRPCWRYKDELISDILLWTLSHGCASVGQQTWTYLQQLCMDIGRRLEVLLEVMDDREEWPVRGKSMLAVWHNDDDDIYIYIYIKQDLEFGNK